MSLFGMEIGNGWIISVFVLAVAYVPMIFGGKASKRLVNFSFTSSRGKVITAIMSFFFLFWLVYPVFLQIRFESILFIIGSIILAVGAVCSVISFINYFTTPLDQAIQKGLYRISRNPIYVFMTMMGAGLTLMLKSPLVGIALAGNFILQHFIILEEEEYCAAQYGESYLEFKRRVPRYLFF